MKFKGSNLSNVKILNRALIMRLLYFKGPLSRIDLANMTGLTQPTITNIINDLIKGNLVNELGPEETTSGRRPISLELNSSYLHAIGINISRYGFAVALVNMNGEILFEYKNDTHTVENKKNTLNAINDIIGNIIKNTSKKIIGIGVGTPGPVDAEKGIIINPPNFKGWENTDLKSAIGSYGLTIYSDNVANACALAEKYFGEARNVENYIYMIVDEGIGAGVVIGDKIFRGGTGHGCELGHITVDINGPQCDCGNRGCLELYATIPQVVERVRSELHTDGITWADIVKNARQGNKFMKEQIDIISKYLSAASISIANAFDPEAIFLGSDIALASNLVTDYIQKVIDQSFINRNVHKIKVATSTIAKKAPVLGAATLVFDKLLSGALVLSD